ncbi:MAG TPA: TIGR04255 family protein [Pyrinomonadaceae bacterium]|nr:TIGR04255 family protein [Pyrinomonadaceae bacterium]
MSDLATDYPELSKAPIVEAVIDFRVKLPSDFKLDSFQSVRLKLAKDYPGFEEQQIVQQMLRQEPGSVAEVSTRFSGTHGYRLLSSDGKNVVQLRRDGFTFSRLHPYTKWEEVFFEAWRVWNLYVDGSMPVEVSRIAVRYINRMLFPLPFTNPEDYLKAPPVTAEGWPREMSAFLTRVVMHETGTEISVNVIQALEPQIPGQDVVALIFDIDAFEEVSLPPNDGTIRRRFDKLREMKNRVFFNGLTTKAIDLFR